MDPLNLLERLNIGGRERLPLVLQTEASECGMASLCMIAAYHGRVLDLGETRRSFGSLLRGATLRDLVRIADEMGFAGRPVRLELEELSQLATPCILHWDLNHFVVLKSVTRAEVVIHDPAAGVRKLSLDEAGRHFTGVALELQPAASFKEEKRPPRVKASQLIGHIQGLRRSLLQLVGIALAIEVFSILSPLFLGLVIDHAIVSADRDLLATLAIGFALLLILRTAVEGLRGWMLMGLNASLKVQARAGLFTHLQSLPVPFFEGRHLGDIMSRFGSQEVILQAITTDLVETLLDGLMGCVTLIIMFLLAPALGALVLIGAVLYGLLRWATYRPLRLATSEAIVWGARRDSHFLETLRGVRTIKLFNAESERRSQWLTLLVETINRQLTADKLRLLFKVSKSLLFGALTILTVWIGATSVLDGAMSAGLLIAFLAYKDQFLERIAALVNKVVDLSMLRLHAERLGDIALTEPEKRDVGIHSVPAMKSVHIEFKNVRFRYGEHEPWILDGVNFEVFPNESVAIIGPSGGGKTTLLKLIAGLLQPTSGEILVNGVPVSHVGIDRYRAMMGVVMQDDSLFAGSIADNIAFFSNTPDDQRIEDSAVLAAIHDDIVAMPMGYGTLIGDMGAALSGGQKQRLLLARAIYRWPKLLLLDEATSHLDVGKEELVNDTLRATGITRVVIAHRPETIRASDRVLGLLGGNIMRLDTEDDIRPAPHAA